MVYGYPVVQGKRSSTRAVNDTDHFQAWTFRFIVRKQRPTAFAEINFIHLESWYTHALPLLQPFQEMSCCSFTGLRLPAGVRSTSPGRITWRTHPEIGRAHV